MRSSSRMPTTRIPRPSRADADRAQHRRADVAGAVDERRDRARTVGRDAATAPVRIAGPPAVPLGRGADQEADAAHPGERQQPLEHEERAREAPDRPSRCPPTPERDEEAVEEDDADERADDDDHEDPRQLADARIRPRPRVQPAGDVDRRPDDQRKERRREVDRAPGLRTGACRTAAASRRRSTAR